MDRHWERLHSLLDKASEEVANLKGKDTEEEDFLGDILYLDDLVWSISSNMGKIKNIYLFEHPVTEEGPSRPDRSTRVTRQPFDS